MSKRPRRLRGISEPQVVDFGGATGVIHLQHMSRIPRSSNFEDLESVPPVAAVGRGGWLGSSWWWPFASEPTLGAHLERLVQSWTREDAQLRLLWPVRSTARLVGRLRAERHQMRADARAVFLKTQGYRVAANRERLEGVEHSARDDHLEHGSDPTRARAGDPVISVSRRITMEVVGDFKNPGREWHAAGHPQEIRCHDFMHRGFGSPCGGGVYDGARRSGWVAVRQGQDTASFGVHIVECLTSV